ncbi:anaphase-promoting complex subunit 2 [Eupeodes corollae]|uniref:anaphase-promoting complex subunit 2 n=1 Tax=Eupeodes corollae TaxID=290404 RepID=UPI0024902672|nr:anaphase-promoting complex subunit 2 [Eupeodes corollae]
MSDIATIWTKTHEIFPILNKSLKCSPIANGDFEYVIGKLTQLEITDCVYESILLEINAMLRSRIVPDFWTQFQTNNEEEDNQYMLFMQFQMAIIKLEEDFRNINELITRIELLKKMCRFAKPENKMRDDKKEINNMLRSILLSQLPANFNSVVYAFYNVSFKVFANSHQAGEDDDMGDLDEVKCNGCDRETDGCRCQNLVCSFNKTNEHLTNLGLLDRIAGHTLTTLIQQRIATHVRDTSLGIFDKGHLKGLEKWLEGIVLNWLTRIFNRGHLKIDAEDTKIQEVIQDFKVKLTYFLYETYANIIIEQFFSIIIDYPDSIPAIDDLKICLEKIDLRKHLIKSLKESLEARILHPGVNTMDILTGYVAAIKTIRHLDSSGVILETVTEPIKEYLRKRSDTVRRVVTGLTEEGPTDLAEELAKSEALKENIDAAGKDEMANWENWQPDPVDATPAAFTQNPRNNRSADIISMVVDIYGSKELFVNEYRNLLADRLLSSLDFNPDREIRNLELLKLRFGETLLHSCEVMLKDISDSKRINGHIQGDISYNENRTFDLKSLIISSQFWPAFNKETLELPEEIEEEFKKFTKSYEAYKGNRTLCWRNVTGRVELEIELGDRTLEITAAPTQAIIIYHFQTKSQWSLEELSMVMKIPPSVLRRRIGFWQTQGILRESQPDVYVLVEETTGTGGMEEMQTTDIAEDDESESAMASASDQREEELQVFWSYIVGMLTNLDSLPIERIHQMLKMFASHGPGIEFSQEELKNFLQRKVREHKLIFSGGVYQLAK